MCAVPMHTSCSLVLVAVYWSTEKHKFRDLARLSQLHNTFTMAKFLLILSLVTVLTRAFVPAAKSKKSALQLAVSSWDDDVESLKKRLLQLGASYDRGFGATAKARDQVEATVRSLELLNVDTDAARGISTGVASPLTGNWRMIWTTAQDVLILGASPLTTVGAIYQVFEPPIVTNIIDFIPKAQSLFPISVVPPSLIRAEVKTRASPRPNMPMRVGLNFESVKLKPVQFLGIEVDTLPPLAFDLPKIPGADSETSPGYFDVLYLDQEMLIIRQNAPGGFFVSVKTDDNSP